MKKRTYLHFALLAVIAQACVSEGYYEGLNASPVMNSTANLSTIDTIKIGKLLNIEETAYFDFPVTISDANFNLQRLTLNVDQSIKVTDNLGKVIPIEYDLDDKYNSAKMEKMFRIIPTKPGSYTIQANVIDKFERSVELSKTLYVFDNLPPKCVVSDAYYIAPPASSHYAYVDIRSSFDQDAKWGGGIAEYKAIYHYTWQEDTAEMGLDPLGTPGKFEAGDAPWESIGWVEAWVIDNEGTESEHIRIDLHLRP